MGEEYDTAPADQGLVPWLEHRRRLRAFSDVHCCIDHEQLFALPDVLFPPLIVAFLPTLGWRAIWMAAGALILALMLLLALFVLHDRPSSSDERFGYTAGDNHSSAHTDKLSAGAILKRRNFWIIMAAFMSTQCIAMIAAITLAPNLQSRGVAAQGAGLFLAVYAVAGLRAKLVSGWCADRIGNRAPMACVAACSALGCAGLALADLPHLQVMIVVAVLAGVSGGIWTLLASAILAEFGPVNFGRAFSIACGMAPLGSFAPPIVAFAQEASGSNVAPLLCLSFLACAAGLAVLALLGRQGGGRQLAATRA